MLFPLPIKNIGSTCHTNVVLQTILSCRVFNELIMHFTKHENVYTVLYQAFKNKNVIVFNNTILRLKKNLNLIKGQQDAHETLNTIFDYLSPRSQIAINSFMGKHSSEFLCKTCNHIVYKDDHFKEILLPISKSNSLKECVNKYYNSECLLDYKCDKCKTKSVVKRTFVTASPKYLIFVLNRFKSDITKINKPISYPKIFDLTEYQLFQSDKNIEYTLKSVINHIGSVNSGHYYSYNKYNEDNWFKCDDTKITKNPVYINSKNAYILFYELVC